MGIDEFVLVIERTVGNKRVGITRVKKLGGLHLFRFPVRALEGFIIVWVVLDLQPGGVVIFKVGWSAKPRKVRAFWGKAINVKYREFEKEFASEVNVLLALFSSQKLRL